MSTRPTPRRFARLVAMAALAVIAALAGSVKTPGPTVHAQGEVPGWYVKTHVYLATTDSEGRFAVSHGLEQRCAGDEIYGVTVAFLSRADGRYHGGAAAENVLARYTWNDESIDGFVGPGEAFADVPVRILAFTTRRMC